MRQHTDDASPEKRARQIAKCANTTSHSMGIRCCGMHVFDSVSKTTRVWDKHYGRKLNQATFRECLYRFFDNGLGVRWAVIEALYAKLLAIISTVEQLKGFRFYSSSLLIAYNGLSQDNDEVGRGRGLGRGRKGLGLAQAGGGGLNYLHVPPMLIYSFQLFHSSRHWLMTGSRPGSSILRAPSCRPTEGRKQGREPAEGESTLSYPELNFPLHNIWLQGR